MSLRLWPYFLKQALKNIRKNGLVHFIGLGTMVVSVLIFGTFLLLFVNINVWIQGWGHAMSMSVYLEEGLDQGARESIGRAIKGLPPVTGIHFISKEQAMRDFKRALGSQAGLLTDLSRNPLPGSFEVAFEGEDGKGGDPEGLKQQIQDIKGVEEVQYSEDWVERFEGVQSIIRLLGFIIGGLLCLGVLFIVTNTIKLAIYSRKDEIEILKLVGATDWFVKTPFLLEGLVLGLLSGAIALFILFCGYLLLSAKKLHLLGFDVLNFTFVPFEHALAIFLVSTALGLFGSFIALGRFFDI